MAENPGPTERPNLDELRSLKDQVDRGLDSLEKALERVQVELRRVEQDQSAFATESRLKEVMSTTQRGLAHLSQKQQQTEATIAKANERVEKLDESLRRFGGDLVECGGALAAADGLERTTSNSRTRWANWISRTPFTLVLLTLQVYVMWIQNGTMKLQNDTMTLQESIMRTQSALMDQVRCEAAQRKVTDIVNKLLPILKSRPGFMDSNERQSYLRRLQVLAQHLHPKGKARQWSK